MGTGKSMMKMKKFLKNQDIMKGIGSIIRQCTIKREKILTRQKNFIEKGYPKAIQMGILEWDNFMSINIRGNGQN